MSIIKVESLNFDYALRRVLKDVSFNIEKGNITALVGPNGAGKTTLLRCLTGLEAPISGSITIDDMNVADKPREVHQVVGYLSDFFGLYEGLTVEQCLTYMAWCHKIPRNEVKDRVKEVVRQVEIEDFFKAKAETLSRGYRQRLGVGLALIHKPKILLLDEPASGMDPEARIKLSYLMTDLKKQGLTIIVSSHILAELEDYCTDMLVIRDGQVKEHVTLKDHEEEASSILNIGISGLSQCHIETIKKYEGIHKVTVEDETVSCIFSGGKEKQHALLKVLINDHAAVYRFDSRKKSLQSAYMDIAEEKGEARK